MIPYEERMDVRIEVEKDSVLIIFPRKMDNFPTPWQQAYVFGQTLELAAEDIPQKPPVLDAVAAEIQAQKLALHASDDKKLVIFVFEHSDRIRLSYEAARVVARNIKQMAQDLDLESRGVHMSYKEPGRIGRPTPCWDGNRLPKMIRTR